MSNLIAKEDVKKVLSERIKEIIAQTNLPILNDLVSSILDFYENYKIENVDTSFPDEDMLLFEYGVYDWQDGKGENFTINIVRQYYVLEEIPSLTHLQLHLMLYYNKEDFNSVEPLSKWSTDFNCLSDFKEFIINSEGYREALNKEFVLYEIFEVKSE